MLFPLQPQPRQWSGLAVTSPLTLLHPHTDWAHRYWSALLEPGDLVVVTSEALATDAYNDLRGIVDTKEEGGKCNVLFTMVDGTTSLMKIVTKNLIKIFTC